MPAFNGLLFDASSGGGVPGLTSANGGTAISDNAIIRGDGTTGIQGSSIFVSDGTSPFIQLGGVTSSFPAIRTDSANVKFRLGDDSAYTGVACSLLDVYDGINRAFAVYPTAPFKVVGMASDIPLGWASGTDGGTIDTGFGRVSAAVLRATNGSTGVGAVLASNLVEASTAGSGAPNVLLLTESGTVLTNEGATAENYHTLPSAVAGYEFTFIVQDTDGIRITATAGDTIRPIAGTAASATGGFIRCATAGAFIRLQCVNATEWIATGSAGVWTIDV